MPQLTGSLLFPPPPLSLLLPQQISHLLFAANVLNNVCPMQQGSCMQQQQQLHAAVCTAAWNLINFIFSCRLITPDSDSQSGLKRGIPAATAV